MRKLARYTSIFKHLRGHMQACKLARHMQAYASRLSDLREGAPGLPTGEREGDAGGAGEARYEAQRLGCGVIDLVSWDVGACHY